ncbi:MAG TPA: PDZ domain-containing protein [Pyrinomonadaceae bacterium]|jgi:membrane-associated protease RseP (regulator of RpoE activity)
MTLRKLILLLAFLPVFASRPLLAQQPTPATPPTPPAARVPRTPPTPRAPNTFSIQIQGGNFLGIVPEDVTRENMSRYGMGEPRGVAVKRVVESSPAERAGLKAGDVIVRFDSEPVTSLRKLNRLIAEAAPEQSVRLAISRNGQEQELVAKLDSKREFSRAFGGLMPPGAMPGIENMPRVEDFPPSGGEPFTLIMGGQRRIGITTQPLTKQLGAYFGVADGRGALVTNVREDSPAAKAGLRAGDVITEIDGQAIQSANEITRAINRQQEGDVSLTVIRDKSRRTIKVTPERAQPVGPAAPGALIAPQVGDIMIPRVEFPELREMDFVVPEITFPAMRNFNFKMPRIEALPRIETLPRLNVRPLPEFPI